MRKWIALGLAACMTVSSLTGCGSSQKETEAESTAAEGDVLDQAAAAAFAQDVTLTMWGAEEDQDLLREISDKFIEKYGNYGGKITINLTEYAEEASSKKATAGSSNGGSSSPAGVSTGVGPRLSAITVGASSSDKAAKKPNNTQLT